jgi:hypothetical protein
MVVAAVNHHDTGHPHAHVVIRGVALDGHELRLDRAYIAKGLRWRAQELAIEELGPRHEFEIARAHGREVRQERFTSLDREIERCASDQRITRGTLATSRRIDPSTLVARLQHLEALGLAERTSRSEWALVEGWAQRLRKLGARGDILHEMHRAMRGDPARYRVVGPGQALCDVDGTEGALLGRVVQKGLSDELKGTFFALVETPTGVAYRLPPAATAAEDLRPGDLVSFGTRPESAVKVVDRRIAEVARSHGGRYVEGAAGASDAGAIRRLLELEGLGLIRAEAKGQWIVAPDLLEQLERRAPANPPRHRVWIRRELGLDAQVAHAGAAWLDRLNTESLAPRGLGLDVSRAVARRREVLGERGRADRMPSGASAVELRSRAVGEEMAARTGRTFLADAPDGFRGRLEVGPEGSPFAVVSDGKSLVLVPASRELRGSRAGPSRCSGRPMGRCASGVGIVGESCSRCGASSAVRQKGV